MGAKRGSKPGSEHRAKFVAAGTRARVEHRKKMVEMARGAGNPNGRHTGATLDVSPAAWMSSHTHVGDCEFVDDGLDDILIRALHDRVVYGGSVTCHHSTPFQDIAIATVAAAVRADPSRNGRGPKKGGVVKFTERQLIVLALIAKGYSNEEIARELGISAKGAQTHADVLREKLGARSRRELPAAYRNATGKDPLDAPAASVDEDKLLEMKIRGVPGVFRDEPEVEMDKYGFREGRSLTDVVADMFGKETV